MQKSWFEPVCRRRELPVAVRKRVFTRQLVAVAEVLGPQDVGKSCLPCQCKARSYDRVLHWQKEYLWLCDASVLTVAIAGAMTEFAAIKQN